MCVGSVNVKCSSAQCQLKGEDVMLVPSGGNTSTSNIGNCQIFSICDGHASNKASIFAGRNLERIISQNIDQDLLEKAHAKGIEEVAKVFRLCLQKSFAQLETEFMTKFDSIAGSTVSVVVVYGRLVSVANIGDSRAILVTPNGGCEELTVDHHIHDNEQECNRLVESGATIGQQIGGILRIWPAGLALSRSLGDETSKPYVVADPFISQIILPQNTKAKIVLASDGLWDDLSSKQVAQITQQTKLSALPKRLIRKGMKANGGSLLDDTSVVAIKIKDNSGENQKISLKSSFSSVKTAFCNMFSGKGSGNQGVHGKHVDENANKNDKLSFFGASKKVHGHKTGEDGLKSQTKSKLNRFFGQNSCDKQQNKQSGNDEVNLPQGFSFISQDMRIPILRMDTLQQNSNQNNKHAQNQDLNLDFELDFDSNSDSNSNSNSNFNKEERVDSNLSSVLSEDLCMGQEYFNICPTTMLRKDVTQYYY